MTIPLKDVEETLLIPLWARAASAHKKTPWTGNWGSAVQRCFRTVAAPPELEPEQALAGRRDQGR